MKRGLTQIALYVSAVVPMLLAGIAQLIVPSNVRRLLRAVSLERMREYPIRTSLTILGVALGVAALIAVKIVSDSVMHGVSVTIDSVAGKSDLQVSTAAGGLDDDALERIRAVPGVYKAAPVIQQTTTIVHPSARGDRVLMLGVDLLGEDDAYFRDYTATELTEVRQNQLHFLNSTGNILVSKQVAERFDLKLHDKLALSTPYGARDFEVWGFVDAEGLGRAFGGSIAVMYYPSMQQAFGRGSQIDHVDVAVAAGTDADEVARRLERSLGEGFNVERPSRRGQRVTHMLAAVRSALSIASVVAVLAGAMLVFNTMAISLLQRRREIGALRALGTTRLQLVTLISIEGLLLGVVGSALGVLLGIGMSHGLLHVAGRAISKVYVQQAITEVHVRWQVLAFGFANGVVTSVLASMVPALRASRNKVAEALKLDAASVVRVSNSLGWADIVGVGLLGAAYLATQFPPRNGVPVGALIACFALLIAGRALLPRVIQVVHIINSFFVGRLFGAHARLANDNLPRDLGRTAATTTALMAGAALTVGFGAFGAGLVSSLTTWSAQSVPGDLYVTSGASLAGLSARNVPMAPELGDELAQLPGVKDVQPIRVIEYDYAGFPIKLITAKIGDGFARYGTRMYLEGGESDFLDLVHGKVCISESFSHRFGLHKGDTLTLSGKHGPVQFEIAAVLVDYSSDIGTVRLDRAIFLQHWGDARVDTFELHLARDIDAEAVRRSVNERYGTKYDLFVLTNAEFRSEILGAAQSIFSMMRILEFVLLVVAALGIVNSLFANVVDRIREIGVLRSLGMPRAQVSYMILIEAMLVGIVGVVGGALTGSALGYVIVTHVTSVQTGWYVTYQVPWHNMLVVAAITLPIAALAGWYPAKHASGLVVRDALDYE